MLFRTLHTTALVALAVAFAVRSEAAEFLAFSASSANPTDETRYLDFRNPAGKPIMIYRISAGARWIDAGEFSGLLQAGESTPLAVTVHPAGLGPGFHRSHIAIDTSAGMYRVPVNLMITVSGSVSLLPSGKQFRMEAGSAPHRPSSFFLVKSQGNSVTQWSASILPGANWLRLDTFSGTNRDRVRFSVDAAIAAGLAPGAYYGTIRTIAGGNANAPVDFIVVLQVEARSAVPQEGSASFANQTLQASAAGSCLPQNMIAIQTGIGNNFRQTTAWPSALTVKLTDNCGMPVGGAAVTAMFTNGDPPLTLESLDQTGLYSGTWTPRNAASQLSIILRATAPGYPATTLSLSGSVAAGAAPVLMPDGILHAFAPQSRGVLSPGGIVQIFGSNLADGTAAAGSMPLPVSLDGTSVMIGGIRAPLYFVSPGQINAQVPMELEPNREYQVIVNVRGALTMPESIALAAGSPGIATAEGTTIVAQHRDRTPVTDSSPARPGEVISFFLAGLGATDVPVESGAPAPAGRAAHPLDRPNMTINGEETQILQAELTPGEVGLYQIEFQVPDDMPAGLLPVVVSKEEARSNTAMLAVRR